ncbi:hypothetical protein H0X32_02905 [Patescibacteria group bacterium]|nr:hypothetical protein [Patescibacteria group bacterium]
MNKSSYISEAVWLTIAIFVPIAVGLSLLSGVSYINEQQILRLGANEPQEWLAQDVVARIQAGGVIVKIATGTPIAIETDPAPFLLVTDGQGKPVAGTGYLHGNLATIPSGVFDASRTDGKNFVTWQPEVGVREAIVVISVTSPAQTGQTAVNNFVVSGRSLAYVEWEEQQLMQRVFLGWLATMVGTLIFSIISMFIIIKPRSDVEAIG